MGNVITQPGEYAVKHSDAHVVIDRYNPDLDEWVGETTWTDRWGNVCQVNGAWRSDGTTVYTMGGFIFDVIARNPRRS